MRVAAQAAEEGNDVQIKRKRVDVQNKKAEEVDDFRFYLHFVCREGKALESNNAAAIVENSMGPILGVPVDSINASSWSEKPYTAVFDVSVRSPPNTVRDALLRFEQKEQKERYLAVDDSRYYYVDVSAAPPPPPNSPPPAVAMPPLLTMPWCSVDSHISVARDPKKSSPAAGSFLQERRV